MHLVNLPLSASATLAVPVVVRLAGGVVRLFCRGARHGHTRRPERGHAKPIKEPRDPHILPRVTIKHSVSWFIICNQDFLLGGEVADFFFFFIMM